MDPILSNGAIAAVFEKLLVGGIKRQVPNLLSAPPEIDRDELRRLLALASRLALSRDHADRHAAYEIIAHAVELPDGRSELVVAAVETILARLGNFPARRLTENRHPPFEGTSRRCPAPLALEAIAREVENSCEIKNRVILLTDFQRRLLDSLDRWNSVSFSAPTSAGKSFLLSLDIVRQQLRSPSNATIFVVPTRALIRQVMRDISGQFQAFGVADVSVLCVPEILTEDGSHNGVVYVLTQERLLSFLNGEIPIPRVSLVIIDEAQEIADTGRGILLQSSIERILTRFPDAKVLFSSPLRRNPGFLLGLFGRTEEGEYFVEQDSPVSQNVIAVTPVSRRKSAATFSLVRNGGITTVEEASLPFEYRGAKAALLANFAYHLTQAGDSTIIYTNEPSEAESIANLLFDLHREAHTPSPKLQELIAFIERHVHASYTLARLLRCGIAFHYGYMPDIIRTAIEDLAREGEIRFVCCTSTLLQGVNLPARNIIICKPTKGRGEPMEAGDFWNLAGRAGRLTREYSGNVWCVSPAEWGSDPTRSAKLTDLKAAFPSAVASETEKILEAAKDRERPAEKQDTVLADQCFAKVFGEFTMEGRRISDSDYCNDANRNTCIEIDRACEALAREIMQPKNIFVKHGGVLPQRIEELGSYLHGMPDLELALPYHPRRAGALARLREIYAVLEVTCFRSGTESYKYYAALSWHWMTGKTLGDLIENKIAFEHIPENPRKISVAIRTLLRDLDRTIRFQYVKYMRLYNDVLIAEIQRRMQLDLLPRVVSLHTFLEHGSCDDALLHLIGFGLSRTAAIAMFESLELERNASYHSCKEAFQTADLDRFRLQPLVRREVEMIRGPLVRRGADRGQV